MSIPIVAPPFHGVEPRLSLSYTSGAGDAGIGIGWRLGGISTIRRASRRSGAPRYDASDTFVLDRVELLACPADNVPTTSPSCLTARTAFGSSAGFYVTQTENYERIQFDQSNNEWIVWVKNGTRVVYHENHRTAKGTYRWTPSFVEDTHGNRVTYSPLCEAGSLEEECYLQKISYNDIAVTGTPAPLRIPGAILQFHWEARETPVLWANGVRIVAQQRRLRTVDVLRGIDDGTYRRVRSYALSYSAGPNGVGTLLKQIKEFGTDAAVNCGAATGDPCDSSQPSGVVLAGSGLPPLQLIYEETAPGVSYVSSQPPPAHCGTAKECLSDDGNRIIHGDFSGDGRTDFMALNEQFDVWLSDGNGTFQLARSPAGCELLVCSPGTPTTCERAVGQSAASGCVDWKWPAPIVGDFNGDGKTDFVSAIESENSLVTFFSKGDGTFEAKQAPSSPTFTDIPRAIIRGDFDGDGKTDFMTPGKTTDLASQDKFNTWLSNGDGTFRLVNTTPIPDWCRRRRASACFSSRSNQTITGDFNGDGLTDFMTTIGSGFNVFLSYGDGTFRPVQSNQPAGCASSCVSSKENMVVIGDFNGDGMTDFMSARAQQTSFDTFLSNGDGTFTWTANSILPDFCRTNAERCLSTLTNSVVEGDFNGDGRTDFLVAKDRFHIWVSKEDGSFAYSGASPPPSWCSRASSCVDATPANRSRAKYPDEPETAGRVVMGDFDGDAKDEFLSANTNFDIWRANAGPAFLLTRVINPFGGTVEVSYAPTSRWPNPELRSGMVFQTVASLTESDGRGVSQTSTYSYSGALWSAAERRFLGFKTIEVNDGAGTTTITTYRQDPACALQVESAEVRDHRSGAVLSRMEWDYRPTAGPPYQCLAQEQREKLCSGPACQTARRQLQWNDFAELTGIVEYGSAATGVESRFTDRGFHPNAAAYVVNAIAFENVHAGVDRSGLPVSRTNMIYDHNASAADPPTKGELTLVQAWDDATGANVETKYDYDVAGNRVKTQDASGYAQITRPDSTYQVYPSLTCPCRLGATDCEPNQPPARYCTSTKWDSVLSVPEFVTDMNGQTTTFKYDELGRSKQILLPDGGSVAADYVDGTAVQRVHRRIDDQTQDGLWTDTYFDGLGRTYRIYSKGDIVREWTFRDASPRAWKISNVFTPGVSRHDTAFEYDALKRLQKITRPDQSVSGMTFEVNNNLLWRWNQDEEGHTRGTAFDVFGRPSVATDFFRERPSGTCSHSCEITGSALSSNCSECAAAVCAARPQCCEIHRVGAKWDAQCVSEAADRCTADVRQAASATYAHDVLGRVTKVTDTAGNVSTVRWLSIGPIREHCSPDLGCSIYIYYPNGLPRAITDAGQRKIQFTYDDYARLKTREELDGAGTVVRRVEWTYDVDAQGSAHGASEGRVVQVTDSSGSESYWYDNMGRVFRMNKCVTGVCSWLERQFDRAGRLKAIVYPDSDGKLSPDSETVTYSYDPQGRLSAVLPYINLLTYYANGALKDIRYANGTIEHLFYNEFREWPSAMTVQKTAGTPLLLDVYDHDLDGNVKKTSATYPNHEETRFDYDDLHRLKRVRGGFYQELTYDPDGNMLYNRTVGNYTYPTGGPNGCGPGTACRGPHAVQQAGTQTFTYDANGNLVEGGGRQYSSWDHGNRPLAIASGGTVTNFTYDVFGSRVEKRSGTAAWRYFGRLVERTPDGRLVKNYYAGNRLIASRTGTENPLYFYSDYLGSPRLAADSAGNSVAYYVYTPFGTEIVLGGPGSAEKPTGFGGHRKDPETGLVYMEARYYDPLVARFASADSLVPAQPSAQALNAYTYALNNPVTYTDPSGRLPIRVSDRNRGAGDPFRSWEASSVGIVNAYAKAEPPLPEGCAPVPGGTYECKMETLVLYVPSGDRMRLSGVMTSGSPVFGGISSGGTSAERTPGRGGREGRAKPREARQKSDAGTTTLSTLSQKLLTDILEIKENIKLLRIFGVVGTAITAFENPLSAMHDPEAAAEALTTPLNAIEKGMIEKKIGLVMISTQFSSLPVEEKAFWNAVYEAVRKSP